MHFFLFSTDLIATKCFCEMLTRKFHTFNVRKRKFASGIQQLAWSDFLLPTPTPEQALGILSAGYGLCQDIIFPLSPRPFS